METGGFWEQETPVSGFTDCTLLRKLCSWGDVLPLKFLMTSFLAAQGLLLEKGPEPAALLSPFAWYPDRTTGLPLFSRHEAAAAAASSAIFTSTPRKFIESANLNFFWM